MNMTKESLAALLNGREYRNEITREEEAQAKAARLVVVFGYSDDNAELRGAICDEIGCNNGGTFLISPDGVTEEPDRDEREVLEKFNVLHLVKQNTREIVARWNTPKYSWAYETDIPHATFEINEEGNGVFCQGIVFSLAEAFAKKEGA